MNRVRVYSLQQRKNDSSPWRVKWTVDGRDRTRAFRTKAEAELLRSRILTASASGETFDLGTGLPVSIAVQSVTFAELAAAYVAKRWPKWKAASRRSAVDALTCSVAACLAPRVRNHPDPSVLSVAIRNWWLIPAASRRTQPSEEHEAALDWLQRASLPVAHLDQDEADRVLSRISVKRDGSPVQTSTFTRRRGAFYAALDYGVKQKQLKQNPLDLSDWKPEKQDSTVDVHTVMSVTECRDAQRLMKQVAPRYEVVVALHWLAGLRPSEIAHLTVADLTLPKTGWGAVRLTGATVNSGRNWTDDHATVQRKGLKARAVNHVRVVPIPQELVKTLRRHIDTFNLSGKDRLVTASRGGPLNYSSAGDAWKKVREQLFPAGHPLRQTRLYDLRHTNATMLLTSGVPVAVVSARLGHSPAVSMRTYQGVLSGYDDIANTAVDKFLSSAK